MTTLDARVTGYSMDIETHTTKFVDSTIEGYELRILAAPRTHGFFTSQKRRFTKEWAEIVVDKFKERGIIAEVKSNRKVKLYPSSNITFQFSADDAK